MQLFEKVDTLSSLISPRKDINLPVYNWHAFKHSYSKGLVDTIIRDFELSKGTWVLDPFCGGGTTLLACKDAGINAEGYDILPFSVFLTKSKTSDFDFQDILEEKEKLEKINFFDKRSSITIDIPLIEKAFSVEQVSVILEIKKQIEKIEKQTTKDFFSLALLSILEKVSNTVKAGGFLRIVNKKISKEEAVKIFFSKVSQMVLDVATRQADNYIQSSQIITGLCDARELITEKKFDAIITSPPYPNRHDYTRIYSLELIFGDIFTNKELKQLRYKTLRSHVEAKNMHFTSNYKPAKLLTQLINTVKANGVNNPQIISMLLGYFEDMYLTLEKMRENLKPLSKSAMVVSNVRFSGVNIPVDSILAEIAEDLGFKNINISVARYRGNSAQQMKNYDRSPSRESIVIFQKSNA